MANDTVTMANDTMTIINDTVTIASDAVTISHAPVDQVAHTYTLINGYRTKNQIYDVEGRPQSLTN